MWAILSIRVENKPGILFKVTHLFRARNFNIDSISVGVMENPEFSKMTITTVGTDKQIAQIVKQLDKMIDTIEVKRLDEKESCLLYTSPSPRDGLLSRMPSSA